MIDTNRKKDEYESLYPYFKLNPNFLYNYAALMNYVGNYDKGIEFITECEIYQNDYYIQMLKADILKNQNNFNKAKNSYILASHMCPSRFFPLFELVNVYDQINQPELAEELALKIIDKPVKIYSATISSIKNKMQIRLNNQDFKHKK